MTFKFCQPKKPKRYGAKDEFSISIRIQQGNDRVYVATGKKCRPKDLTDHGFNSAALNDVLLPIREKLKAIADGNDYTPAQVKAHYEDEAVGKKKLTFQEMLDGYFQTKSKLATNSVRARKQVLEAYGASLKGRTVTGDNAQAFIDSLDKYSHNTQAKYGKIVAMFLNHYRIEHSLNVLSEIAYDNAYLKAEEVEKLARLKLTGLDARVRDAFLMMCWSGLRISDLQALRPHHFVEDYIDIIQKKTKARVTPVLNDRALKLFKRYKYAMPPNTNPVAINIRIKEICKGIHPTPGDISCHTGRKTFAMGMVNRGVPVQVAATQLGDTVAQLLKSYYSKEHAVGRDVMRKLLGK